MAFGGWYGIGFGWDGGRGRWRRGLDEDSIRLALLAMLEEKPRLGYELMLELEERSEGALEIHADSVYPVLQLLVDADLVTVTVEDGRKRYELTDTGRAEVEERREEVERLWKYLRGGLRTRYAGRGTRWRTRDDDLDGVMDDVEDALYDVRHALRGIFCCGPFGWHGRRRRRRSRRCC